jgi:trk system potassium uptake protein TrkH
MSTLSTSGIIGEAGTSAGGAGLAAEAAIFAFLIFAVSRRTFASDLHREGLRGLIADREVAMAGAIVGATVSALFVRHWIGASEVSALDDPGAMLSALWGSAFTVLSFLTTTGFVSAEWEGARAWSGLETPGVLLVGLTMFGGGVATTAGGVKLLRVWALYQHGRREMDLLVHPSAVGGGSRAAGRLPEAGLDAAWIFFMLFATSLAGLTLLLAMAGTTFHQAIVLATAGLSTTGPLIVVALPDAPDLITGSDALKTIFCAAMVLGRMETLALIALFNPEFWRR